MSSFSFPQQFGNFQQNPYAKPSSTRPYANPPMPSGMQIGNPGFSAPQGMGNPGAGGASSPPPSPPPQAPSPAAPSRPSGLGMVPGQQSSNVSQALGLPPGQTANISPEMFAFGLRSGMLGPDVFRLLSQFRSNSGAHQRWQEDNARRFRQMNQNYQRGARRRRAGIPPMGVPANAGGPGPGTIIWD